ncbi:hypothetical protein [uncultured Shewanella sp.]|nr:hypothetical protein [uncultured Shewanella sp.]
MDDEYEAIDIFVHRKLKCFTPLGLQGVPRGDCCGSPFGRV